jgi:nucleoside-diphosphate-sugar epimerase
MREQRIIAITGGAGFIGTALARLLIAAGHNVRIIDVRPSSVFPAQSMRVDVRDAAALTEALKGVDVIYHLAAEHRDDVTPLSLYYDVNVGGANNVVAAAETHGIKQIIFTSSVALYGLGAGASRESDTPAPFNDYGASKWQSEQVLNAWATQSPERTLITTRLVATFGPGNRGNIYNLMAQIAGGRFMMVGRGHNRKSIAYVENVAAFLQHCFNMNGQHVYNYADAPDLTMREMVALVRGSMGLPGLGTALPYPLGLAGGYVFDAAAAITGKKFPISAVRIRKFCADTMVNAEAARATGFQAPYTLEHGLQQMMAAEFVKTAA